MSGKADGPAIARALWADGRAAVVGEQRRLVVYDRRGKRDASFTSRQLARRRRPTPTDTRIVFARVRARESSARGDGRRGEDTMRRGGGSHESDARRAERDTAPPRGRSVPWGPRRRV